MQYKGYNISDTDSVLLYDILLELKSIKEMLTPKQISIVEAHKPVTEVKAKADTITKETIKKPTKKPVKSKVTKNKTK